MNKHFFGVLSILVSFFTQASEFPANVQMNEKTIQALIEAGSNPQKPHPLEHHFYSYRAKSLKGLISKGESLGYRAANTGDNVHEGSRYWYVDLIKETPLDIELINTENSLMLKLANEFSAEYDGWGTPVVD